MSLTWRPRFLYRRSREVSLPPARVFQPLLHLGGERGWYYADWLWSLREKLDRMIGGPAAFRDRRDVPLREGGAVGLWHVEQLLPERTLLLSGRMLLPGEAWLRFDVEPEPRGSRLTLTATFEARPLTGRLYWILLYPIHAVIFRGMLRELSREAGRAEQEPPVATRRPQLQPRQRSRRSPCMAGCPSGTDIRGWITTIAQREKLGLSEAEAYERAWHTITDVNPLPAITGRICTHPCESGCNRSGKEGAVSVKQLERFIGDWALEQGLQLRRLENDVKPETIGVVGSGPAGLSFAYQLARRGYKVTVYERQRDPGGMLRHGIPVYRLPRKVLDGEIRRIFDLGVELRSNTRIGAELALDDLRRGHGAVFCGIGAAAGTKLGIAGEEGPGVFSATDYLERVHLGDPPTLGSRVVIVGGGDTAFDAARMARRAGAHTMILYRRSRAEMSAQDEEIEEARIEGVQVEFLVAPVEIVRRDGQPVGVVVRRMQLGGPDESGRRRALPVPGSDYSIRASAVVIAVSRKPDWVGLELPAVDRARRSNGSADAVCGENLWIGGDAIGPGIASMAIAHGRGAAEAVHAQLRGLTLPADPPAVAATIAVRPDDYPARERVRPAQLDSEQWLEQPEAEIHRGISEEQFRREVKRCLSCGSCFGCERCWMYCAHGCFSRIAEVRPGSYFALSTDACRSCGKCMDLCPCGFLGDGSGVS